MGERMQGRMKASAKPDVTASGQMSLQRKCACGGSSGITGKCDECEQKRMTVQRRATGQSDPSTVPQIVHEVLRSPGQPLDADTRASVEPRFGHSFANVRVHTDERAAASAQTLDSLAYTTGDHIVFAAGRYSPGTPEGKKLLEHEAAHIAHQAHNGSSRPGVAPTESAAEQRAQAASGSALAGFAKGRAFKKPVSFGDWGPTWEIHTQKAKHQDPKIKTLGTTAHTGEVEAPFPEPPVGVVEVRTGEEIELPNGARLPNVIALKYSGTLTSSSKWLQFIWATAIAVTPEGAHPLNNTIPLSGGPLRLTTDAASPFWDVDSKSTSDPFYEAGFSNIRDKSSTTIFDRPGDNGEDLAKIVFKYISGATEMVFTCHFDTYLIQKDAAAYHVSYRASIKYTMSGGAVVAGAIGYTVEDSGPVTAIPEDLKKTLDTSYGAYKQVK
jgi:hypothetical protein